MLKTIESAFASANRSTFCGLLRTQLRERQQRVRASKTGASLRDLVARMGHENPRAALIYQHACAEADQSIADAVNAKVIADRRKTEDAEKKASRPARPRRAKKRPDDPDDGAGSLAKVG